MNYAKRFHDAEQGIKVAQRQMVFVIRDMLVGGMSYGEIAKELGKKHRQTVAQFYKYHRTKI